MEKTPPAGPAQAVQDKQQQDAKALFERLQQIEVTDLTVHYTLEHSSVTLPAGRLSGLSASGGMHQGPESADVVYQCVSRRLGDPCRTDASRSATDSRLDGSAPGDE
jgi:hypothetical protein